MARIRYMGGAAFGYPVDPFVGGGVAGSGWFTGGIRTWNPPTDPETIDPVVVDNSRLFPLPVSLRTAMKWFWKVKRWRLDWEYVYLGVPNSGSDLSFPTDLDDERELSTQNGLEFFFYGDVWDWGFSYCSDGDGAQATRGHAAVYKDVSLYRPSFLFTGGPPLQVSTLSGTTIPVVGQLTMDGEGTVDLYSSDPDFSDGVFMLTPEEYWPYAKLDSTEPIYDSATGSELLDPFQNQDPLA